MFCKLWQLPTIMSVAAIAVGVSSAAAQAAAKLTLSPASASPGTPTKVAGSGFGPSEVVDVFVDGTAEQTTVTKSTGAFSTNLPLPAAIKPGQHDVTAVGRTTDTGARAVLTITTPWTQEGFDGARTTDNPYENQITQATVNRLAAAWIGATDGTSATAPVVSGGRVFVATYGGGLFAFRAACGESGASCAPLWHAQIGGHLSGHSPVVVGSMVVVRTGTDIEAFKVSCASGGGTCSPVWTAPVADQLQSPIAASATRLYVTSGSSLEAFNATCGAATCSPVWSAPLDGSSYTGASVVNGVVYTGSSTGTVYAFSDAKCAKGSCAPLWTGHAPQQLATDLTIANGEVMGGDGGALVGFSLSCASSPCAPVWNSAPGGDLFSHLAIRGSSVFEKNTSLQRFTQDCASSAACSGATLDPAVGTDPAVAADVVYTVNASTSGGQTLGALTAFAPDCTPSSGVCPQLWSFAPSDGSGERFDTSAVISDGTVYDVTNGGNLYAFTLDGRAAGTTP